MTLHRPGMKSNKRRAGFDDTLPVMTSPSGTQSVPTPSVFFSPDDLREAVKEHYSGKRKNRSE